VISKIKSCYTSTKALGAVGPLLLFTILGPGIGVIVLVTSADNWLPPLQQMGLVRWLIFFLATTLLTGLSLIPTHATSLIAGMLFGTYLGPCMALISVISAALFGYLVMSRLVSSAALNGLMQNPKAKKIHHELFKKSKQKTTLIISLLRLSPLMPFAASNLVFSVSKTPLPSFLLGSAIGLAPRVIIVALAGVGLSELDLSQSRDQTIAIIGFLATVLAIVLISKIVKKALTNKN
jgi:uncharacterized membrane protein YdjX (TVP38/TMEM64 family)